MSKRTLAVSFLTAGLTAGILATAVGPAAAQGHPVGGSGNVYFLSGAVNHSGVAQKTFAFGDRGDEVYFGDWYGEGTDLPLVRRGNVFFKPNNVNPNLTESVFAYGDVGDTVLIGDWDGDGYDSIAVRRGNHYFVKNDMENTGKADSDFYYGEAGDKVLVGNWNGVVEKDPSEGYDYNDDGDYTDPAVPAHAADVPKAEDEGFDANKNGDYTDAGDRQPGTGVDNNKDGDFDDLAQEALEAEYPPGDYGKGDTIMVQRGNEFFVKNSITTGKADYTFFYGDAGDTILVGDWATPATPETAKESAKPAADGDGADQLAVRRGNIYHQSTELAAAAAKKANPTAGRVFAFGDVSDTVFVASLPSKAVDEFGRPVTETGDWDENPETPDTPRPVIVYGDGLGVRR